MRNLSLLTLATLSAGLLLAPIAPTSAIDGPLKLAVTRVDVRFRDAATDGTPMDSLKIRARLGAHLLPKSYDPAEEGAEITIGPVAATSFPPVPACATLVERGSGFVYRERKTEDCPASRRLKVGVAKGRLSVKVKRVDLAALRSAGLTDVLVSLRLGETSFEATITLSERGSGWRYKASRWSVNIKPRPDVDPPDDDPPPAAKFRILATGAGTYVATTQTAVARNQSEYDALWTARTSGAPPAVDFGGEIVVVVDQGLGGQTPLSLAIRDVVPVGSGARVHYRETMAGPNCPIPMFIGSPYVFAAIPRVSGSVSFQREVVTDNCQ